MNKFKPHINPTYPPNNHLIFEEWFSENYTRCNTDRELLPFFPTSFFVNNNYAQDLVAKKEAQDYIDSLPNDKKYFIICQYDDGCLIDWGSKDVLEFNMSKNIGVSLSLLCMPHPFSFTSEKKYFANFVGGHTHPIRESVISLMNKEDYYISFEQHNIESYCRILHESLFTLCYRGYGSNSFRIAEAIQYGSIPVYISDEYILPKWCDFSEYGVLIHSDSIDRVDEILKAIPETEIITKQNRLKRAYEKYYSYDGNFKFIISELETEYHSRQ